MTEKEWEKYLTEDIDPKDYECYDGIKCVEDDPKVCCNSCQRFKQCSSIAT